MITITGWLRYECGEVFLTFEDPEIYDFNNAILVASGEDYQEGEDNRSYLSNNSCIDVSFWKHFKEEELDALLYDGNDISFEMILFDHKTQALIDSHGATQDSELEISEDDENEDEIKNNKPIASKQQIEVFHSSLSSLI